jgi:ankyrin repeat protein
VHALSHGSVLPAVVPNGRLEKTHRAVCAALCHDQDHLVDASAKGDLAKVTRLLEDGANPNPSNSSGVTALRVACGSGNLEIAALLIDCGANLGAANERDETALHLACDGGFAIALF